VPSRAGPAAPGRSGARHNRDGARAAPGGRVVLVEPDYGTLFVGGADRWVTRRILAFRQAHFRAQYRAAAPGIAEGEWPGRIVVSLRAATSTDFGG